MQISLYIVVYELWKSASCINLMILHQKVFVDIGLLRRDTVHTFEITAVFSFVKVLSGELALDQITREICQNLFRIFKCDQEKDETSSFLFG